MHQYINYIKKDPCGSARRGLHVIPGNGRRVKVGGSAIAAGLIVFALFSGPIAGQDRSPGPSANNTVPIPAAAPVKPAQNGQPITINDAVTIFLRQNLQLVAAKYDVDIVEAEKLTAKLRPDPQVSFAATDVPVGFNTNVFHPGSLDYGISQTFELGGKRKKRIDAANADADLARAQFETVVWQMTNDVKKKFYTVVLAKSQLDLALENQKTFGEIVDHTRDVLKLGEISGLDLQRLEIEKFKFDTDVANAERDHELALRDLRLVLGGDYRAMNVDVAGDVDYYQPYDFSLADLTDKALAARPDLKAAKLSERSANAAIRLQDAQRIPDITVGGGFSQVSAGSNTYNAGVSIPIPIHNRNQEERAKALIQKSKALNDQQQLTNQVLSDVDKAYVAFEIQKRRIDLYRTGVLTKVNNIQTLTEFSLKAGESSILELLDAIRTRRDTLSGFYQTLFDYQSSLLDLELATATPLQK